MPRQHRHSQNSIAASVFSLLTGATCMGWQALDPVPASPPTLAAPSTLETVTFSKDIAPIIFAKCASCHHPGEAAPFSLLTYDDVRGRSTQIVDVTRRGFMPPWMPSQGKGDFIGARRLSDREIETIARWVAEGAQAGDPAQTPAAPVFTEGWQTGTPDLVIESCVPGRVCSRHAIWTSRLCAGRLDRVRFGLRFEAADLGCGKASGKSFERS